MARIITSEIARCRSVVALSDTYIEWGSSFDYIHTSAALVKCSKLPVEQHEYRLHGNLTDRLCTTWLSQLPLAEVQGCSNVLWACVRLGPLAVQRLWGPTWEVRRLQRVADVGGTCTAQDVSSPLWACAKIRQQPSVEKVQLLVHMVLLPAVFADAKPQALANVVWALGELCQLPSWKGGVGEQDVQQLLGEQQLQLLVDADKTHGTTNVLVGLAKMAGGKALVIGVEFARACSSQLLSMIGSRMESWVPQHISNTTWACGELRLANEQFVAAAVAAAPRWLPDSTGFDLTQAASACAKLEYREERFLLQVLKRAGDLVRSSSSPSYARGRKGSKRLTPVEVDSLIGVCSLQVANINMPQLAGPMRDLIVDCGVRQRSDTHPANTTKLWLFHSWLLQHQLLDGKGLGRGVDAAPAAARGSGSQDVL